MFNVLRRRPSIEAVVGRDLATGRRQVAARRALALVLAEAGLDAPRYLFLAARDRPADSQSQTGPVTEDPADGKPSERGNAPTQQFSVLVRVEIRSGIAAVFGQDGCWYQETSNLDALCDGVPSERILLDASVEQILLQSGFPDAIHDDRVIAPTDPDWWHRTADWPQDVLSRPGPVLHMLGGSESWIA